MGLLKTVTLENGIVIEGAYFRVDTVSGSKDRLTVSVNGYVSKDGFENGQSYLQQSFYSFVPDVSDNANNFIRQAYAFLKDMDAYIESEDVLEEGQEPLE